MNKAYNEFLKKLFRYGFKGLIIKLRKKSREPSFEEIFEKILWKKSEYYLKFLDWRYYNWKKILKNFKIIKAIINASPQGLSLKAKIPYKTSIKICKILNEEYKL